MFERFTERARQAVVLAQEEARAFKHNHIGTEHLLLGLLREPEGGGGRVLESLGVTLDKVREAIGALVGHGEEVSSGQIPFTPRSKKVLELALREALSIGHNYIGTEHILLGLVRENEGVGARILLDAGHDAERIRAEVYRRIGASPGMNVQFAPQPLQRFRQRRARVHRWQYRLVEAGPDDPPAQLDELGAEGWELVLSLDDGRLVFKRPSP